MSWSWSPDETGMTDEDEWYEDDEEDEADRDMQELEQAIQDCDQDDEGWCSLAGTEHCDFRCRFRKSKKQ